MFALHAFPAPQVAVAGLIPCFWCGIDGWRKEGIPPGWPIFSLDVEIVLWCAGDFYVIGKGALAPWDPPRDLVIGGL